MAIFALPALGAVGTKLAGALTALKAGGAAGAAAAKKSLAAGAAKQLSIPGFSKAMSAAKATGGAAKSANPALKLVSDARNTARMAGNKFNLNMADDAGFLDRIKRGLLSGEGFKKNLGVPMTKEDIAMTVAPDLLFGGIAAATTEGDIVDKALAGAGSAAGGIVGGIGLRGAIGPKSGLGILGTEMVGGIMGDQAGYGIANSIIRAKNGGMTPAEQSAAELDGQYKQQIIDQYLRDQGLA